MEATSATIERRRYTQDPEEQKNYLNRYISHLKQEVEGISAHLGEIIIPKNGEQKKIPCVSIDNIVGLPKDYSLRILPKKPNSEYYFDFILYTPGKEEDKFLPNGQGPGRAKVEFGNDIRSAIYQILMSEGGMKNLTFMPVKVVRGRWGITNEWEVRRMQERIMDRYSDNQNSLWLYYTSHFDGKEGSPAFVVHIPQDPYQAVPILKRWFESIKKL